MNDAYYDHWIADGHRDLDSAIKFKVKIERSKPRKKGGITIYPASYLLRVEDDFHKKLPWKKTENFAVQYSRHPEGASVLNRVVSRAGNPKQGECKNSVRNDKRRGTVYVTRLA